MNNLFNTILAAVCIFCLITADWNNTYEVLWWGFFGFLFTGYSLGFVREGGVKE